MFWESTEEIKDKRSRAETSLAYYQGELETMNSNYTRLLDAKDKLEQEIADIYNAVPNCYVYTNDIEEGCWQGAAYDILDESRLHIYNTSTGRLIGDVNDYIERIGEAMRQLEGQADEVNRTIRSLNSAIGRYTRRIKGRS